MATPMGQPEPSSIDLHFDSDMKRIEQTIWKILAKQPATLATPTTLK